MCGGKMLVVCVIVCVVIVGMLIEEVLFDLCSDNWCVVIGEVGGVFVIVVVDVFIGWFEIVEVVVDVVDVEFVCFVVVEVVVLEGSVFVEVVIMICFKIEFDSGIGEVWMKWLYGVVMLDGFG